MSWDSYKCGICGGDAPMGIMSLIARCVDCGAQNTTIKNGRPSDWIMYCSEGADRGSHVD